MKDKPDPWRNYPKPNNSVHPVEVVCWIIAIFGVIGLVLLLSPGCGPTLADIDAAVQTRVSAAVVDMKHTLSAGRDNVTGFTATGLAVVVASVGLAATLIILALRRWGYTPRNWKKKELTRCVPVKSDKAPLPMDG